MNIDQLAKFDVGRANLVSIDIFDTLLIRPVSTPEDVHEIVGWRLAESAVGSLDPSLWRRMRIQAERDARLGLPREVTIGEIYRQIDGAKPDPALEIEIEGALLSVVAPVRDFLRRMRAEGRRIAFVSDMYLPSDVIEDWVRRADLRRDEDLLLVSSSSGATKRAGTLFLDLVERSRTPAARIFHLGDNPVSDCLEPRKLGLNAAVTTIAEFNRFERSALADRAAARLLKSATAGSSRAVRLNETANAPNAACIRDVSASVAGPLLTGFVLWTLSEAQRLKKPKLLFFARDGQILTRLARILVARFGLGIEVDYLLASRQALFVPAFDPDRDDAGDLLRRIGAQKWTRRDVARMFSIPAEALEIPQVEEWDLRDLVTLLRRDPNRSRILSAAAEKRRAMSAYFERHALFGTEFAICDLGWKGNLQVFLSTALGTLAAKDAVPVTGLYLGLLEHPPPWAGESLAFIDDPKRINAALAELFCAADHGSVAAYSLTEASGASLMQSANEEALAWGLTVQQQTIESFARVFAATLPARASSAHDVVDYLRRHGVRALEELSNHPTRREAEIYGAFRHAQDPAHAEVVEIAPASSSGHALWSLAAGRKDSHWPVASAIRSARTARGAEMTRFVYRALFGAKRRLKAAGFA